MLSSVTSEMNKSVGTGLVYAFKGLVKTAVPVGVGQVGCVTVSVGVEQIELMSTSEILSMAKSFPTAETWASDNQIWALLVVAVHRYITLVQGEGFPIGQMDGPDINCGMVVVPLVFTSIMAEFAMVFVPEMERM